MGDIKSSNNGTYLNAGVTPDNATFLGTSTRAKYA